MPTKKKLFSIIEDSINEFQNLSDELSPEILHQKGTLKNWAVRDDVIHCAVYVQRFADRLGWPRDHAREDMGDFLKFNDVVWENHQTETWEEALGMWEKACRDVIKGLEPLSDEDLGSNKTFTWLGEQPPVEYVPGLIYVHAMFHKQYIFTRNGMIDATIACADKVYQVIDMFETTDVGRGRNLYNKACSYALVGQKPEAIQMVKEALKLSPNLLEWSKQDTDLDCLRDDPVFKAIYQ
ncbi:MAG: DinB family protein [Anaerolineaceae bacterium]